MRIATILAPIDFSETSMQALDYAVDLAAKVGATVKVVHVYQIPLYSFPDGVIVAPAELAAELSDKAQKNLDTTVAARKNRGVEISGLLVSGVSWEEISDLASKSQADLIVMGTHGRHGIQRALLGSVAEKVIRSSTVPVLVVHGPRGAA